MLGDKEMARMALEKPTDSKGKGKPNDSDVSVNDTSVEPNPERVVWVAETTGTLCFTASPRSSSAIALTTV